MCWIYIYLPVLEMYIVRILNNNVILRGIMCRTPRSSFPTNEPKAYSDPARNSG